jgi:hypothetical protein
MDGGLMDEEIFATIFRGDKPKTLATIEPFHLPALLTTSTSNRSCYCHFRHRRDE